MNRFIAIVNRLGRALEMLLTGQSDFHIITSEFVSAEQITNLVQAQLALKETRQLLHSEFGIKITRPVLLRLEKPQTHSWKESLTANLRHVGNYRSRWLRDELTHEITIIPGLERHKFMAVASHELTHAFQCEGSLLKNSKSLKEGMSRWIEYHILLSFGLKTEAKKLKTIQRFLLGRSLNTILEYELEHGRRLTLKWLISLP